MKRFAVSAAVAAAGSLALFTSPAPGAPRGPQDRLTAPASNADAKVLSAPVGDPAACPADMVDVEGDWCPEVEQVCVRPVDPQHLGQDRCAQFAPTGRCLGTPQHKHFCIDRYEWPNKVGAKPVVAVDWDTARGECTGAGKRLCIDDEWTLACEGQEHLPYPYGYVRDPKVCNIDKPYIVPDEAKWANPKTRQEEIVRLDQRDPSGARASCVSPYGVYDMTGNVDEWVVNDRGKADEKPYVSGLKGGYWGPVRDRCRPMTTAHNEWHTGYQIGFRCCADLPDTGSIDARAHSPSGSHYLSAGEAL
jgi:hypothetical protein